MFGIRKGLSHGIFAFDVSTKRRTSTQTCLVLSKYLIVVVNMMRPLTRSSTGLGWTPPGAAE